MLKIVTLTMMSFMHSSWKTALFNIPPLFRRTKAPLAGLDISMRGIRLVELRAPDKHLLQLQCCSCETLPQGAIANDEIEDLDLVRTAVQRLWAQSGSGSRRVAIGIPAATAVTALLPLGATVQLDDEDQLTALANAHIASLLPYPIEQACVDFCVQAPLRDKLGHQLLIGAARRDIIEDRLAIAEALDLHVAVVEIDSCAEYAAWTRTLAPAADPSSATEHVTGLLRIDSGGIQLSMFVSARQTNEPLQYHHHRRASEQRNDTPLELARAVVQMWFHGLAVAQRATTRSPDAPTQHSIVLTGTDAAQFVLGTTCGSTLGGGANCFIHVHFQPTAQSTVSFSAAVTIIDSASNSPQTIALSGEGTFPQHELALSTTRLVYGTVSVGADSSPQSVIMTNISSTPVTIYSIALAGTNPSSFVVANNCGTSLAAGASCVIHGHFAPTATGPLAATITVTYDSEDTPETITLRGTGQ